MEGNESVIDFSNPDHVISQREVGRAEVIFALISRFEVGCQKRDWES